MRRALTCLTVLIFISPWLTAGSPAYAATLNSVTDTLSNDKVASTSSHTLTFMLSDSGSIDVQQISIRFSTTSGGTTKPSGMSLGSATLGTLSSNLGSGWSIDTGSAASGLLVVSNSSPVTIGTSANLSVELDAITNQTDINLCDPANGTLSDTCFVKVSAYSDAGSTLIGSDSSTYTVIQDPSMDFQVNPVAAGTTHNGITTDLASTDTLIDFGTLAPDQVHYVAQQIYVATNAPHGYTVYAYMDAPLTGEASSDTFSPFGATDATWTTPQPWTDPTGAAPGSNSGWIAANTTDTRVSGWSGTMTGKFGPISSNRRAVAHSDGPDSGTTVTVTYALGVSIFQSADSYKGHISYAIDASY